MKVGTSFLAAVLGASMLVGGVRASAVEILFDGRSFDSVDWDSASTSTNLATGTAAGVTVSFQAVDLFSGTIGSQDYSTDAAFDALSYPSGGTLEHLEIFGASGSGMSDVLTLSGAVQAVLLIIGAPNATAAAPQYGPSLWDFDDGLSVAVVDTENNALSIVAGNVLDNVNSAGTSNHASGVVIVEGPFTSLSWLHALPAGSTDRMDITFAFRDPRAFHGLVYSAFSLVGFAVCRRTARRKFPI